MLMRQTNGSPRPGRRIRPPIQPAHLLLQPIRAHPRRPSAISITVTVGNSRRARTVLVEQVREEVLLLVGKPIEEAEEVCLVPEDELRGDDARRGGLADDEGCAVAQGLRDVVSVSIDV